MSRRSILTEDEPAEIDLSPMIACLFLILAFFIVATAFVEEKGLQISKPDAAASLSSLEKDDNVVIEITAENKVLLDGQRITLDELTGRVKNTVKDAETRVTIRAHEKASHGTFALVWDAARRAGAENLTFSTTS